MKRGLGRERVARPRGIAGGGELRGDEQGDHTAPADELTGPLNEREREVGTVREAAAPRAPPSVTCRQPDPLLRRDLLAAHPGRVAQHEIESAAGDDVGEVRLAVKPRQLAIARELPACDPERPPFAP